MLPAHAVSMSSKSCTTTSNKIKINFRLQAVNFHPNLRRRKNEIGGDDTLRDIIFIMDNNEDSQLPYVMVSTMVKNLKSKSHTDMSFRYCMLDICGVPPTLGTHGTDIRDIDWAGDFYLGCCSLQLQN